MNNKTLLAGKAFALTARLAQKLEEKYSLEDAPSYIKFDSILIGDEKAFSLYNQDCVLLFYGSVGAKDFKDTGLNETCSPSNVVEDFYKLKSTKKGKSHMGLSTFVKKLMDKDLKAMHDLGYVDSNLSLTEAGTDWLLAELFLANKSALGEAAREELAEKKKKAKKCDTNE